MHDGVVTIVRQQGVLNCLERECCLIWAEINHGMLSIGVFWPPVTFLTITDISHNCIAMQIIPLHSSQRFYVCRSMVADGLE